ncbi:MAG TPA: hypothetical protein VFK05_01310 [Polyangiaceae bacterium]|nr:hypothetical protein [Polyangiaceae bacterium]
MGTPLTHRHDWRLASDEGGTYLRDPEGLTRCAPGLIVSSTNFFADASCSEKLVSIEDCVKPFAVLAGFSYFRAGAPVQLEAFPVLTETTDP